MDHLFYLKARGLTAWLDGDRLMIGPKAQLDRLSAPVPAKDGQPAGPPLGDEIRQRVRENRASIIAALCDPDAEERFWHERAELYGRLAKDDKPQEDAA